MQGVARIKAFACRLTALFFTLALLAPGNPAWAKQEMSAYDQQLLVLGQECADAIVGQMELLLSSGKLTMGQLFDTFYIPIPNITPQRFHTQYDTYADEAFRPLLDRCLGKDPKLIFVVLVDRNGYLPTHNSKYSQPLTGNSEQDVKWNRSKRIFNDTTGLAAARNTSPFLKQQYNRDTGEVITDISIPIMVQGRHWGALRLAY